MLCVPALFKFHISKSTCALPTLEQYVFPVPGVYVPARTWQAASMEPKL